jgi:hypothetical protein
MAVIRASVMLYPVSSRPSSMLFLISTGSG